MPATDSNAHDPFVTNLLLVLVLGVAASAWLLAYTDWFPEVGGLLALGGLFSWLGAISKVLSDERLKGLQASVEAAVFANRRLAVYVGAAFLVLLAGASCAGTIEVQSRGDSSDRLVWFGFDSARPGDADQLPAAGRLRDVRVTTWWSPRQVRVKVSGFPSLLVHVRPWQRRHLTVPASFLTTPVVLLVPSKDLAAYSHGLTLRVQVDGLSYTIPFDGHAVWVGCEDDVPVPAAVVDEWRATMAPELLTVLLSDLQFPRAIRDAAGGAPDLRDGSVLHVALLNEDGTTFVERNGIPVRAPGRPDDFPQMEALDVPGAHR
jgi:hypothetical protein